MSNRVDENQCHVKLSNINEDLAYFFYTPGNNNVIPLFRDYIFQPSCNSFVSGVLKGRKFGLPQQLLSTEKTRGAEVAFR